MEEAQIEKLCTIHCTINGKDYICKEYPGRICQEELPDGYYKYSIRDCGCGYGKDTIHKSVAVDHLFDLIFKEEIDLGKYGFLEVDRLSYK